ncbi:MAG: lipoprotein-releasing ABC transporter permease subunit [Acidobacteriaceae bacterium]|jgi:lipoprotein-releasing system permease protein|nr:lipoprotein-releasing ABC transporter permease subunit [Acidobacteriaceae bacterium]
MTLPFELHIALRYLLAKRKQAFISVISFISILGVTVGVMALVIALALMTGLHGELQTRILGSNPHIFVWKRSGLTDYRAEAEKLRQLPHVIGAAPTILERALISSSGEQAFINVKGIDPALEPSVTAIAEAMRSGTLDALSRANPDEPDAILLGSDLAAQLHVSVGDSLTMLTAQGTLSPMGLVPRQRRLKVAGTFSLGLYEIDSQTGFVALDVARRLFDKDGIDAVQLRLDDIYTAPQVSEAITKELGDDYVAQDWADMNRSLFSALTLEKVAISLTITLIVLVAALNIVASLVLLVMEKHRDIAILKTMGASARSITVVFMLQGVIIGIVGTLVGASLGWGLSEVLDRYELIKIPADVYQVSHLPFKVLPGDFALVVVTAVFICFLATIYPSRQAAKLDPAQALRYE